MNIEKIKEYIAENKLASINEKRPKKDTSRNYQRKYLYALLRYNDYSYWEIAEFFNLKSHGSVIVGIREYHNLKENKVFIESTKRVRLMFPFINISIVNQEAEHIALIELEKYGKTNTHTFNKILHC